MIIGVVTPKLQAIVHVLVCGPLDEEDVEMVVDTGFNSFMTLPIPIIHRLGLEYRSMADSFLADGSRIDTRAYVATVMWDGAPIYVDVIESSGTPLLGMSLLHGHEVHLNVIDGGSVEIEQLT